MSYLRLQITSTTRGLIYSADFEPASFDSLARQFASQLVEKGILHEGELFKIRIVPRWSGTPRFDAYELLDSTMVRSLSNTFIDIAFEEPPQPSSVLYLTLRWHAVSRRLFYQQDFTVDSILQWPVNQIASYLMQQGMLAEGEHFRCSLLAFREGTPQVDPTLMSNPIYLIIRPQSAETISVQREAGPRDFKVTVTDRVPLVRPKTKTLATYQMVEAIGRIRPGDLRVYVARRSWLALHDHARISRERNAEVAGILLGDILADERGELFVEVSAIMQLDAAQGTYASVRIDSEVWRGVIELANTRFPGKTLVGWYHTHLISKVRVDAAGVSGEFQAAQETFLSADDIFVHDSFFTQAWHVALVIDLHAGRDVFFHRQDKALVDCGGFYLFEDRSGES